ncbi:hypothetical protein INT48_005277 [Thamnidium elegans]|uniref:PPM-type phosphatase domain-containing protein n=2 Tax=Thamnidium elegans TaxID=101142 RepID=A0A8H7SRK5_9FUNG|nr:hypothetical protein INT48_005277 [Thamnidium elegans]
MRLFKLCQTTLRRQFSVTSQARHKDYYLTKGVGDSLLRIQLNRTNQLVGTCSSRGSRPSNEDQFSTVSLDIPATPHVHTMNKEAERAYVGIFDGYRGYFKRFPIPSVLKECVDSEGRPNPDIDIHDLTMEQRITIGFLYADMVCLKQSSGLLDAHLDDEGSTGSIAIVEPHDKKAFWESEAYDIIVGHVGDTRILLCDANTGHAISLTTGDHHPGNPVETDRLRKYAGFVTTDSWGDERIMGMLATSRAFGDAKLKRFGVSAEPDIVRYSVNEKNPGAFIVLVTDGITSVMSDQEVVDIYSLPSLSAKKLVDAADHLQSDDNVTAVVVRLKHWGKRMHDYTNELRAYRMENSTMSSRQSCSLYEEEEYMGHSLEEELLGKGYLNEVPLGSSLAAELKSATVEDELATDSIEPTSKLATMAMSAMDRSCDVTSPLLSPLQWSASTGIRSRRSSFSSSWSSLNEEDDDPFELLKRQLEDLNTAVWETKTLHKRLLNTLSLDETLKDLVTFSPPLEFVIQSVINNVQSKSRDRERQTNYLRNLDGAIRKEASYLSVEALKDIEVLLSCVKNTLNDSNYSYENPLPAIRTLTIETSAATESLEELKEIMYVNKRQVQELNSRLRSIAKTVHEVRKDMRRINKFIEEKDDEDPVVLEKGEAAARVKEIMWGLDDIDDASTKKIKQIQAFCENAQLTCT